MDGSLRLSLVKILKGEWTRGMRWPGAFFFLPKTPVQHSWAVNAIRVHRSYFQPFFLESPSSPLRFNTSRMPPIVSALPLNADHL